MRAAFTALSALVAAVLLLTGHAEAAEDLAVRTKSGALVGVREGQARVFKGIPYAAPAIGPLRWRSPQPPIAWTGERKADAFGPPCAQFDFAKAPGKHYARGGVELWTGAGMLPGASEDCLTLNLWAPLQAKKAPVMVFIYGGGGQADTVWWNGESFARDGVVLVNFNYRNLTMGKFSHPALTREAGRGEPTTRYDLMDAVAVLQWVKANAAAFGGDPNNVTIFGQSAGGAAVLQLLVTPSAKGLFHKAIVESGVGWWAPLTLAQNERLGAMLATKAGLPGASATAEQLRALPPMAMPQVGHMVWDGRVLPQSPTEAIAAGRAADVPLMVGWNNLDGSSLRLGWEAYLARQPAALRALYDGEGKTGQDLALAIYTDEHNGGPARWTAAKTAGGAPSYLYHFSYVISALRASRKGAQHSDELPHVFDSWAKGAPTLALTEEDKAVTRRVHGCWIAFARTGKPACEGAPDWPRYDAKDQPLMDFGATAQVRRGYRKAQLDAHEALMPAGLAEARNEVERLLAEGF